MAWKVDNNIVICVLHCYVLNCSQELKDKGQKYRSKKEI